MAHGTLENLSHSSFVRTPPEIGVRIYRHLLTFPSAPADRDRSLVTALDPAAGEGDLLLPLLEIASSCQIACSGIEISAERAVTARSRLAQLGPTILTSSFEGVKLPAQSISLAVLNPPYFFVNGRRAEYQFVTRTTAALVDQGILVAILPARSAWDRKMASFWSRWYEDVRIWKVPSEEEGATESAFERYRQIVVIGRKRAQAVDAGEARIQSLLAYRWRTDPKHPEKEGWAGTVAPPTLPAAPLADPYRVPEVTALPVFEVQDADEALILETLLGTDAQAGTDGSDAQPGAGAYLSAEWEQATTWQEEALLDPPIMPYTGVAHVAAEIMCGMLGGEIVTLGGTPYVLSAFVGGEWSQMTLDADTKENLRSKGVIRASAKQLQDYPVLGVLNLRQGQTVYYEGNAVFDFLAPWIATLADYAQRKRPPLYQLQPEEWELRVLTHFGLDKQLPQAAFSGLAPEQMHRVCAMGRALDERGLVAIQGEPGTGKTRLAMATAARQAYAWQQYHSRVNNHSGQLTHPKNPQYLQYPQQPQPDWMRKLRRTWLKNPRTLAMLALEPVYGERLPNAELPAARTGTVAETPTEVQISSQIREDTATGRVVAYRRTDTGVLILPEHAGPRALPVLVTTPKKVTKEYEKEIRAAWPEAETMMVQRYDDIPRWLQRCVDSSAPAVIAICSHSQSQPRGSGRLWEPAVSPYSRPVREPVLEPAEELLPQLTPIYDGVIGETFGEAGEAAAKASGMKPVGFRQANGELLMKTTTHTVYRCPDCFGIIRAIPGKISVGKSDFQTEGSEVLRQEAEDENESLKEVVTSQVWFEKKPRWCTCDHSRNVARRRQHCKPLRSALWTEARTQLTQQKYPRLTYGEWAHVMEKAILSPLCAEAQRARVAGAIVEHRDHADHDVHGENQRSQKSQKNQENVSLHSQRVSRLTRTSEGLASIHLPASSDPLLIEHYDFVTPPSDSFGVYEYLIRFFQGCVALTVVDESHNGRAQNSDIARALHRAMRAAQSYMLTSGTHYGGDVQSFYYYWFRFHPAFWRRLGLTWKQSSEALRRYGVIQLWMKEYESDARRGGGKTTVQSTVPAPGLSAKLLPYLLADLCFLTVLDVGAYMPPKVEIPVIVSMHDEFLEAKKQEVQEMIRAPKLALDQLLKEKQRLFEAVRDGHEDRQSLQEWSQRETQAQQAFAQALEESKQLTDWIAERDLLSAYLGVVKQLATLARKGNQTARMAQGTIPRWFAILPCEKPYELWQTKRSNWGETLSKQCIIKTPQLAEDYVYLLEKRLLMLVQAELEQGRRLMLYIDQNQERSTARRLEWVLQQAGIASWTLPNTVKPEDRQQKIIEMMRPGPDGRAAVTVALVPYSRVNEGINLQSVVDTIIWYEMALNLFMLEQASRRAWRLGKREEVRIYYLAYAGTAGHQKMRKLGGQSGAAAAFAGEPARGALIEEAGADRTTLARFSETVEAELLVDDEESEASSLLTMLNENDTDVLTAAFARRADEERAVLQKGRTWFGLTDTLPDRLPAFFIESLEAPQCNLWNDVPASPVVRLVDSRIASDETVLPSIQSPTTSMIVDAEATVPATLTVVYPVILEPLEPLPDSVKPEVVAEPDGAVESGMSRELETNGSAIVSLVSHVSQDSPVVSVPMLLAPSPIPASEITGEEGMEPAAETMGKSNQSQPEAVLAPTSVPTADPVIASKPASVPRQKRISASAASVVAPVIVPETVPVVRAEEPMAPVIPTVSGVAPVGPAEPSMGQTLIFGNVEHIRLARQRRTGKKKRGGAHPAKPAKTPRVQVQVRDIPAVEPPVEPPHETVPTSQSQCVVRKKRESRKPSAPSVSSAPQPRTLWDFVDEQVNEQTTEPLPVGPTCLPQKQEAEHQDVSQEVSQKMSREDIDALFQQARTSPAMYETYRHWLYTHAVPVHVKEVVTYALWRSDLTDTWAVRYFIDDQSPIEQRYTGFHGQEDALAFVCYVAPSLELRVLTFQQFSQELALRAQNEHILD